MKKCLTIVSENKIIHTYCPYCECDWSWKNKNHPNHKRREWKTWKYTRKTQWKNE